MTTPGDPYARLDYRRLVAWPERIRREEPFLREVLSSGPNRRVLDLGCGTGEHARFLASIGLDVTGVDSSAALLSTARQETGEGGPVFVEAELAEIGERVPDGFGAAICLGNTLPHLSERVALRRFLAGLSSRLLPGAPFLLQVLNYDRIFEAGVRSLPLDIRAGDEASVVFLRLMEPRPDGTVLFNPTTLTWRPGGDPPVAVAATRNVLLRGYRRAELEAALAEAGFPRPDGFGGMARQPWSAEAQDTVLVARRGARDGS